jgi:type IV pilus assembly protein PilY1
LIQQYSNQIKYAVFGYLNTASEAVQGGVLREPMEFVGPTYPQPLSCVGHHKSRTPSGIRPPAS